MSERVEIPFLPGNSFYDPLASRKNKNQGFTYVNGYPILAATGDIPDDVEAPSIKPQIQYGPNYHREKSVMTEDGHFFDPKAAEKNEILYFDAFFEEDIPYSSEEKIRIRKVKFVYFCLDHTMQVIEKKEENSALNQGILLKRQKIPLEGGLEGQYIEPVDLNVGINMTFYGRTYRVVDCDQSTRNYLTRIGVQVNDSEFYPSSEYAAKREILTQTVRTHVYKPRDNLERFLDKDRQVLRFYCIWDDTNAIFGEKRPFVLHFFPVDDTAEIREVHQPNDSRDQVSVFLRRQRLPKTPGISATDMQPGDYYTEDDLMLGDSILVYGRRFLLDDCDLFTKQFLSRTHGIPIAELKKVTPVEQSYTPVKREVPPPTGFGSEEDSLGSVKSLIPQPPKRDFQRLLDHAADVLRYGAKFVTTKKADMGRRFVLSVYLADNTIQVYEAAQRNSGFLGGKFLDRRPLQNPKTGKAFEPGEFFLGAEVTLNHFVFQIVEADEFALKYMEAHDQDFPRSNLFLIMEKLKGKSAEAERIFASADVDESGFLSLEEFSRGMHALAAEQQMDLEEQEIVTLMRRLDFNRDGKVSRREFLKIVQ